ncbi:MAG: hypothetical protein QXX77_05830 [Candidatus Methanosuratincola sp.]|jgi:hypothetical protein
MRRDARRRFAFTFTLFFLFIVIASSPHLVHYTLAECGGGVKTSVAHCPIVNYWTQCSSSYFSPPSFDVSLVPLDLRLMPPLREGTPRASFSKALSIRSPPSQAS